jgi:hypothetical protein
LAQTLGEILFIHYASPAILAEQGRNMELLCPNCQKKLTVPEQYAGQIMRCPLCQGTFNVPSMPSTAAAESAGPVGFYTPPTRQDTPAVPPEVAAPASELPPISAETPSAHAASAGGGLQATPSAGYTRICAMKFKPQVVQWLPLGFVAAFILTFFPWIFGQTVGFGGISVGTPSFNAWDIGFGEKTTQLEAHPLVAIFDVVIILAAVLAIASLVFGLKVLPDVPALKPIIPLRTLIVGGAGGLAWLFLTLQCVVGLFGRPFTLQLFGVITWWITTISVAGAFIEFWLEKRGPGKPVPRMSVEW